MFESYVSVKVEANTDCFVVFRNSTTAAGSGLITAPGLHFLLDSTYDNLKVTNDAGNLDLTAPTVTKCSGLCSIHGWCTSFFYTKRSGQCSLHATVFVSPSFGSASMGTRYYRQVPGKSLSWH